MLGEAGADAPDGEHREAAVHEEDEVGGLLSYFFSFFIFLGEFSPPFSFFPSSLTLTLASSLSKKNKNSDSSEKKAPARSLLTSVNDASRALASTPPAGRMLVMRSGPGAGAATAASAIFSLCFFFFFSFSGGKKGGCE